MSRSAKLKPMSDLAFRLMVQTMNLGDHFRNPADVLKAAPLKQGMTVVDYACGPGRYTIAAAEIVGPAGRVYAVDLHPLAIDMVRKKATARSLANVHPVLVDSFDTGIPGSTADAVLFIDAISVIRDRATLFREVHRLLKPDGFLFLDPTHMGASRARKIVEGTGLFEVVKANGGRMLLSKRLVG